MNRSQVVFGSVSVTVSVSNGNDRRKKGDGVSYGRMFRILFFLMTSCSFAAAPLFHAVIAEQWLDLYDHHYTEEQKRAFMLGTLFPDIRYLARLPRSATHFFATLDDMIKSDDPFEKGMILHNFVDYFRWEHPLRSLATKHLEGMPGDDELQLKLLEDLILYNMREEHASDYIAEYFESIDEHELNYRVPYYTVQEWHDLHGEYFKIKPTQLYQEFLDRDAQFGGITKKTLHHALEVAKHFENDEGMKEYVLTQLDAFYSALQQLPQQDSSAFSGLSQ